MKLVATQYQNSNFKIVLGNLHEQVIVVLDDSSKDRVIAVQNAARAALKEWMRLKLQIDAIADVQQDIDLEQSNKFLKKNSGTGGGQVFVNQVAQQGRLDIRQQLLASDLDQTVDFSGDVQAETGSVWEKALKLDEQGFPDEAVQLLLSDGDDLYLLRFLMQFKDYKALFSRLKLDVAQRLVDTLIVVLESDFLNILCLDFV